MNAEELRDEIARLEPWHHAIEVAPGISTAAVGQSGGSGDLATPGAHSPEAMMRDLLGNLFPGAMEGRSFLDCACNAGGYLFAARKLGAGRCFGFDARQHWIDQARFLARHLPSEDIAFARCALADLPALHLGRFDVTLFKGIFYHLPDPVAGLRIAADHTSELLIVNSAVLPGKEKGLMLSPESTTAVLSGMDGLAWLPTGPGVIQDILAWCGFGHCRIDEDWAPPAPPGWRRIQVLAARDEATFAHYDTVRPDAAPGTRPGVGRRLFRRLGLERVSRHGR